MKISPTGKGSIQIGITKIAQYDNDAEFQRIDQSVADDARRMRDRADMVDGYVSILRERVREMVEVDYPFLTKEDTIHILRSLLAELEQ